MLRILITAFVAVLFGGQVHAQSSDPLTPEMVKQFIDSMPDLQTVAQKYGDLPSSVDPNLTMEEKMAHAAAPFSAALGTMRTHAAYEEMADVVEGHGFSGMEQWAEIGDRVIRAYGATQMDAKAPEMDAQMKQALEEIENANMSESQKQMMREMLQSSQQMMGVWADVPPADKAAVQPFMSEIENLGQTN